MNHNPNKNVPEWSLQLTEQLMSPKLSRLPSSSAIMMQPEKDDEQFEKYIDQQFTSNDATLLKNRLSETPSKKASEATTLRGSSGTTTTVPPWPSKNKSQVPHQEEEPAEDNVWWLTKDDHDGFYSLVGLFFLFGFLFPPFWWIGSVWPRHVREKGGKMAERWQKLNRIMSIGFSTVLIILIIVFAVLYSTNTM